MVDKGRVERSPCELCVLVALRAAIRHEACIEGDLRWRDRENDLPGDFETTRTVHYAQSPSLRTRRSSSAT
ncbi:hypothetical protein ACWGLF_44615 [Streptomyces puniciscabiei]